MRSVLALAAVLTLAGCGSDPVETVVDTAPVTAPVTLPDGSEATPQQTAYLAQVEPYLTADNATDVLGVLSAGQVDVCDLWRDPVASKPIATQMLIESGYNQTEATAIHAAAVTHLCPEK